MDAPPFSVVATLLALSIPVGLSAQEAAATVGDRVRVRTVDAGVVVGLLQGMDDGLLRVQPEDSAFAGNLAVPLASVRKLQVHRGTRGAGKRGALMGLGGGVLFGMIHGGSRSLCNHCSGSAAGVEMILFGLLGTAGGAIAGSFVQIDRWETVPIPPRVPGGLGASIRF